MAQGRVPQERNVPPVLTGTPVAGIVYLDRPTPAGYFIFPDLSVRHEGKYRLSFSLYEEVKNAKDDDQNDGTAQSSVAGDGHVTHRLEVRSEPFVVFSAKKFPGLTESTSLSRVVAEQGCRVRIRRDVRMRRREAKVNGKDWDEYEDETAQARARMSATPDPNMYAGLPTPHGYVDPIPRPRSASNASNASHHSVTTIPRRPSLQDLNAAYQPAPYGSAPHTPQSGFIQSSPYGSAPAQPFQQSPYPQQQPAMMQPPPPPLLPSAGPLPHNYAYGPGPSPYNSLPHGHDLSSRPQRVSADYIQPDVGRSSSQYMTSLPPPQPAFSQSLHQSPHWTHPSAYPPSKDRTARPTPLEAIHPPAWSSGASRSVSGRPTFDLPPLNTAIAGSRPLEASSPNSAAPSSAHDNSMDQSVDTNKRAYGKVFSDRHQNRSYRNGARPNTPQQVNTVQYMPNLAIADDDVDDADNVTGDWDVGSLGMQYRRADGRRIMRALPPQP